MARQTSGDRLKAAIEAKAALETEIKELQAAERQKLREEDDRRFAIMGRTLCAHIADNPESPLTRDVSALLDKAVTRSADRNLFTFLAATTTPPKVKASRAPKAALAATAS